YLKKRSNFFNRDYCQSDQKISNKMKSWGDSNAALVSLFILTKSVVFHSGLASTFYFCKKSNLF
ncbi:MAG: hypothetical protein RPR97_15595, partial [Colwellia sp.]